MRILEYKNKKKAIQNIVSDSDKIQYQYIEMNRENNNKKIHPHKVFISEPGLYGLIFRSKMQKAESV